MTFKDQISKQGDCFKPLMDFFSLHTRCLLPGVTNIWLFHIHFFLKLTIEKCCTYINLVQLQILLNGECNECMDRFQPYNRKEGLIIIRPKLLLEALSREACFEPFNLSAYVMALKTYLLLSLDCFVIFWCLNQLPYVIVL